MGGTRGGGPPPASVGVFDLPHTTSKFSKRGSMAALKIPQAKPGRIMAALLEPGTGTTAPLLVLGEGGNKTTLQFRGKWYNQ